MLRRCYWFDFDGDKAALMRETGTFEVRAVSINDGAVLELINFFISIHKAL